MTTSASTSSSKVSDEKPPPVAQPPPDENNKENNKEETDDTASYYDAILPILPSKDMLIRVGMDDQGRSVFVGYEQMQAGREGPAQAGQLVKNEGDIICSINHVSTTNKTYWEVLKMLQAACAHPYVLIRFQDAASIPAAPSHEVGHNLYITETSFPWLQREHRQWEAERKQWEADAAQWGVEKRQLQRQVQQSTGGLQKLEQKLRGCEAENARLEQLLRSTKQQLAQARAHANALAALSQGKNDHPTATSQKDDKVAEKDNVAANDGSASKPTATAEAIVATTEMTTSPSTPAAAEKEWFRTPPRTSYSTSAATSLLSPNSGSARRPKSRSKTNSRPPPHLAPVPSYDSSQGDNEEEVEVDTVKDTESYSGSPQPPPSLKKRRATEENKDEEMDDHENAMADLPVKKKRKKHKVTSHTSEKDVSTAAKKKHSNKDEAGTDVPDQTQQTPAAADDAGDEWKASADQDSAKEMSKPVEAGKTGRTSPKSPTSKMLMNRKQSDESGEEGDVVNDQQLSKSSSPKPPPKTSDNEKEREESHATARVEESQEQTGPPTKPLAEEGNQSSAEQKESNKLVGEQNDSHAADTDIAPEQVTSACPEVFAEEEQISEDRKLKSTKKRRLKHLSASSRQYKKFSGEEGEVRCRAITKRNKHCKYSAVEGSKYCHSHANYIPAGEVEDRNNVAAKQKPVPIAEDFKLFRGEEEEVQCEGETIAGNQCKYCAASGSKYCALHSGEKSLHKFGGLEGETQCSATSKRGNQCHWCASKGSLYCRFHANLEAKRDRPNQCFTGADGEVRCDIITKRGKECRFAAAENSQICTYHQEKLVNFSGLKRYTGRKGQVLCQATTTGGTQCRFCADENKTVCSFHAGNEWKHHTLARKQDKSRKKKRGLGNDGEPSPAGGEDNDTKHHVKKRRKSLRPDDAGGKDHNQGAKTDSEEKHQSQQKAPPQSARRRASVSSQALREEENAMKMTRRSSLEKKAPASKKSSESVVKAKKRVSLKPDDLEPKKSIFRFPVGTMVKKHFDDHGWFLGEVDAVERDRYHVRYEDGDEEEFMFSEQYLLEAIVVNDINKNEMKSKSKSRSIRDGENEEEMSASSKVKKNTMKKHALFADTDESQEG